MNRSDRKEVVMLTEKENRKPSSRSAAQFSATSRQSGLRKKILLVEGEEQNRQMLNFLLREEGHRVASCQQVSEAVELFEKEKFDFVITEHSPRRIDGLDLLARIKQRNEKVPVLVMSSMDEKEPYIAAMNLGALDYLHKPVDYSQIQRLIKFS
jgi:DNA-binding response OmpR family regulator